MIYAHLHDAFNLKVRDEAEDIFERASLWEIPLQKLRGVYVLISSGTVVYVGQSKRDISNRLESHLKDKTFDHMLAFVLPREEELIPIYEGDDFDIIDDVEAC